MEAHPLNLRITKGPRAGETLEFMAGCRIRVGRVVRGNNVHIKDAGISSKHLAIDFDLTSGKWALRDLGSSNGTFLNGESVSPDKPYILADGDVVKIGEHTSISVDLDSYFVDSKRITRQRAAIRADSVADGSVLVVSGVNESKAEGRVLKCEVVELEHEGLGNAGTSKEEVGPGRMSTRSTRGRKKEMEKKLVANQYASEYGDKEAPGGRRTRAATRSKKNLGDKKQVGAPENGIVVKEMPDDLNKGIRIVELVNHQEANHMENLKEHGVESLVKRNESKGTRAGSRRRNKLDEEKKTGFLKDAKMLHKVEEAPNEGKEDKENAEMLILGEDHGNAKWDNLTVDGTLKGTNSKSVEVHSSMFDDRGSQVDAGNKNAYGVNDNSREDCSLPDLTKITLREWFDLMEAHLPKQIIFETEKMIVEMRTKAARVREYVAELKNNNCKEPVQ
ncbi:hypothetical protein SAY87_023631 [Trapa incisa]|uniref:FHA domain-containing protein n=1 Tax=Trapa incisa TaxID=236973 RepID=A0AAN7QTZ1_9MYRT|nr:hypothetical protein SAY87_023631 [Trapa incisa]